MFFKIQAEKIKKKIKIQPQVQTKISKKVENFKQRKNEIFFNIGILSNRHLLQKSSNRKKSVNK